MTLDHDEIHPAARYGHAMIWLLAHQGGWDEALLFVAPLAIVFFAISAFERRARKHRALSESGGPSDRATESEDGTGR
jgi:hypothetical protein